MSKKRKKNAQPATEPEPENLPTTIEPEQTEGIIEGTNKQPIPADLIRQDLQPEGQAPKLTAEQRLEALENRLKANEKEVETAFGNLIERLTPVIQLSDKLAQAQQQQQGTEGAVQGQQQNPLASIGQLLPLLQALGGAGGGNPLGDELTKKVLEAGMSQMFAGTELLKAMQNKFLSEWGAAEVKKSLAKSMDST